MWSVEEKRRVDEKVSDDKTWGKIAEEYNEGLPLECQRTPDAIASHWNSFMKDGGTPSGKENAIKARKRTPYCVRDDLQILSVVSTEATSVEIERAINKELPVGRFRPYNELKKREAILLRREITVQRLQSIVDQGYGDFTLTWSLDKAPEPQ